MALLSVQLVISMIMATFISKFSSRFSVARWLLTRGLVRYLHPTDEQLRSHAPATRKPRRQASSTNGDARRVADAFTVRRDIELTLAQAPVRGTDLLPLKYYAEYQWLLDFSVYAALVYLLTELYYTLLVPPGTEFNLAVLWCALTVLFAGRALFTLSAMYFRGGGGDGGGERVICVVFGCFFAVLALAVVLAGGEEHMFDFGLRAAHRSLVSGARALMSSHGVSGDPPSYRAMQLSLVAGSALCGALLAFPGMRLARMHSDALHAAESQRQMLMRAALLVNLAAPLLITVAWLTPVSQSLTAARRLSNGDWAEPLMSEAALNAARLILIGAACTLRLTLIRPHLQAYLDLAERRVARLRREAGRIAARELQRMVAQVYYYLGVVTLQYTAPLIGLLYLTVMLKTLGSIELMEPLLGRGIPPLVNLSRHAKTPEAVNSTSGRLALSFLQLRGVFTHEFFRGVLSYWVWWTNTAWLLTTTFGVVYYSYFTPE